MKVSHAWLQSYFKETIPTAEKLGDLFTFHSFEVEGIEEAAVSTGKDAVLDVKILPDRAHFCLSHKGIAEEISVLTGASMAPVDAGSCASTGAIDAVSVVVEDGQFCRRYMSRRINDVTVGDSPAWMKDRLEAIGERSINNIVDATNYVMLDTGQPLHAFDADKVKGTIVVRGAKEGEKITLLDGKEVELKTGDYVIADEEGILAIAGVKGGKKAEVTSETKNIILESANFHPTSVRKTSTRLNIRNNSSKRFENEITAEYAPIGMDAVTDLIKQGSPDAAASSVFNFYPQPETRRMISVSLDYINERLGMSVPKESVLSILNALGVSIEERRTGELVLTIPHHRLDLVIKEDVVEEVGRIYGYDKVEAKAPAFSTVEVPPHSLFYASEWIKNILAGFGFSEVYLYTLVPKGDIEVAYPLASDKKALRTNLSEGMARALEMNVRNADFLFLDDLKLFEIGKVFTKKGEHTSLCIGIKLVRKVKGKTPNEEIRQTRERLIEALGAKIMTACTIDDTGGILLLEGKQIGMINNIDGILELNLDALAAHLSLPSYESLSLNARSNVSYKPFSVYPFMVRDIAVFVPGEITADEVFEIISSNGTDLLIKHNLFDTFKKDGKTSYAFRLIFQSYERTLTDEEVSVIMSAISAKLKEKEWEVR